MHRFIIMRCQCEDSEPSFLQMFSWHMPCDEKCEQCLLKREHKLFKHSCDTKNSDCYIEILLYFINWNIKHKINLIIDWKKNGDNFVFQSNVINSVPNSTRIPLLCQGLHAPEISVCISLSPSFFRMENQLF